MSGKYHALRSRLIEDIAAGIWRPGESIPSRNSLARKYNYSRGTVDRAVKSLIGDGLLAGRQGSSTRVASPSGASAVRRLFISEPYRSATIDLRARERFFNYQPCPVPMKSILEEDAPLFMPEISAPGSAMIWSYPGLDMLGAMHQLSVAGIPQLLINREFEDYDRIGTDQRGTMRDALAWLLAAGGRDVAMLSYPGSMKRPYLYERLMAFYEMSGEIGLSLHSDRIFRDDFSDVTTGVGEAAKQLFIGLNRPLNIAVLHRDLAVPLVACARTCGKEPGRDYHLMIFDYVPELAERTGVAMVRQRFDYIYHEAVNWLNQRIGGDRVPFRKCVRGELLVN